MTEIKDAVKKLSKVNQLKKYNNDGYNYRKYLSATAIRNSLGDEKIEYNSDSDTLKQIFTFLLCQELNIKAASIIKYMKEKCNKECEYINKILSTSGAYISFLDTQQDIARVLLGRIGGTIMSLPKKRLPRPQNISGLKNMLGSSVLCSLQLF